MKTWQIWVVVGVPLLGILLAILDKLIRKKHKENSMRDSCPRCGCKTFYDGPHGGSALNIKCSECGATWWYGGPFGFKPIQSEDCYFRTGVPPKRIEDL